MPVNASPDKGLDSPCHEIGQWLSMGQSACLWAPFLPGAMLTGWEGERFRRQDCMVHC